MRHYVNKRAVGAAARVQATKMPGTARYWQVLELKLMLALFGLISCWQHLLWIIWKTTISSEFVRAWQSAVIALKKAANFRFGSPVLDYFRLAWFGENFTEPPPIA